MNQLEEYIWENIPLSLSEEDRLNNTKNYQIYSFVIETIKHFGNSPQHKEIVWKDYYAFCGCKRIGHVEEDYDKRNIWIAYDYKRKLIRQILSSEQQAMDAVEQAFTNFYQSVTK